MPKFTAAMLVLVYDDFMATEDEDEARFFLGEWFSWKDAALEEAKNERFYRAYPHRRPPEETYR